MSKRGPPVLLDLVEEGLAMLELLWALGVCTKESEPE